MSLLIILLEIFLLIDCVVLIFFVLLQLPKKEAGAGVAFGGSAADALFGAGSGNVLTKITKYVAGIFFALSLLLAVLSSHRQQSEGSALLDELKKGSPSASIPSDDSGAAGAPTITSGGSNTAPSAPMILTNVPESSAPASGTNH